MKNLIKIIMVIFLVSLFNVNAYSAGSDGGSKVKKENKYDFNYKNEEKLIRQEIEELEKSNILLSDNLDTDYIEILLRDKFLLGKKGETVYIIKNE